MSRLDEVDIAIYDEGTTPTGYWADVLALCRTLAAEVDARDEVIAELLAMLKTTHSKARYTDLRIRQLYEQACEIAGRTE